MMLARSPAAAPVATARRAAVSVRMAPVARASPKQDVERVQQVLEQTIKDAEETCAGGSATECASAFDAVEEVSAALAHKQAAAKSSDPLEEFCDDNPETDECRIYDN